MQSTKTNLSHNTHVKFAGYIAYFESSTRRDKGNPLSTSPLNPKHFTKLRLQENNLGMKQKEPRHASY